MNILAIIVTGARRPRGSNTLAIVDRIVRLVIVVGIEMM